MIDDVGICFEHCWRWFCRKLSSAFSLNALQDGICHVMRAFEDDDVIHAEDTVDPVACLNETRWKGGVISIYVYIYTIIYIGLRMLHGKLFKANVPVLKPAGCPFWMQVRDINTICSELRLKDISYMKGKARFGCTRIRRTVNFEYASIGTERIRKASIGKSGWESDWFTWPGGVSQEGSCSSKDQVTSPPEDAWLGRQADTMESMAGQACV